MKIVRVVILAGAFLAALVPCGLVVGLAFLLLPDWALGLGAALTAGIVLWAVLRHRRGSSLASEFSLIGRQSASKEGLL